MIWVLEIYISFTYVFLDQVAFTLVKGSNSLNKISLVNLFHVLMVFGVNFIIFGVAPESVFAFLIEITTKTFVIAIAIAIAFVTVIVLFAHAFVRTKEMNAFHSLYNFFANFLRVFGGFLFNCNVSGYLSESFGSGAPVLFQMGMTTMVRARR